MRNSTLQVTLVALICLTHFNPVWSQYERRTAIVEAVDKTKDGIVTLKVSKNNDWGKRSVVGTGIIVDERGYMITNHHVIEVGNKIQVTLADKSVVEATIHTELPQYDLAILRLPAGKKKYKALSFGPGSDLMVGETIIAVGNPHGYANSVCTGIISALGREITMPSNEVLKNLIQHNAAINPGNSGGPLLNINGEVIGINVALREGAQGISFAINADTVKEVLRKHLSASKVSKVTHGLKTEEKVEEKGRDRQRVIIESAADETLKKGDVILAAGTLRVNNRFDLERAMWGYKEGERIELNVLRAGKEVKVQLILNGTTQTVSTRR